MAGPVSFPRAVLAGLLLAGSVIAASAQPEEPDPTTIAEAAGHRAMFTCSATFNGGRSWSGIRADELDDVFVDNKFGELTLPEPVVDTEHRTVSVVFDSDLPPRISIWRPQLGCVALPVGASMADFALPPIRISAPSGDGRSIDWPMGDRLPDASPLDGATEEALGAAIAPAFDGETYGDRYKTTAVMVLRDGQILAEHYREDFDLYTSQRTWSVAKSIAASVIGIAVGQGLLEVDAPALIPEWSAPGDPRARITLANLLNMASGLYRVPNNQTDYLYYGGGTVTETATEKPLEAQPGERWLYSNDDTLLAVRALRAVLDDDERYHAYPFVELLNKIGMRNTNLETDWQGNFVLSSQVWTTARDLARLGQLYLQKGVWDGEQILPKGWTDYVAKPAPAQPAKNPDGPTRGYGAQFWLYADFPGVPADTYAMLGNRGQFVIIVPSRNVVIVRRGYDASGTGARFDGAALTAAVLEALD